MLLLQVRNFPLVIFHHSNYHNFLNSTLCPNFTENVDAPSTIDQVTSDQAAPEQPVISDAVPTGPACQEDTSLPEAATREHVSEPATIPSSSVHIDTSAEVAAVRSLKNSLLMAFEFESRLRELSSQAELMKTSMHVSTYVSFLSQWM